MTAIIAASCAPDPPPAPPRLAAPSDFETAIARLEAQDPGSPEALSARLQYADFLAGSDSTDCHKRLDMAQAQLDAVGQRPALQILLPLGRAKLESGAYKIHAARADCDPSQRRDELQKALQAALGAVGLYRDGLDYQSAVIMQFNAAATEQALGDQAAAISALQAAIAMDRDYGFRDDAADNIRLLQHWRGEDESDAKIAELMKDFPARKAEFKFDWSESDADVAIDAAETDLRGAATVNSTGAITVKRHVRKNESKWDVSYEPGIPTVGLGNWPPNNEIGRRFTIYLLGNALFRTPKFGVRHNGDFDAVHDARDFEKTLLAQVSARFGDARPGESEEDGLLKQQAENLKAVFSPPYLQANAAEAYNLETATWAGAKLEQGVWYQMSAPLFLPGLGIGTFLVIHDIEFSYTRPLACAPGDKEMACAEIVVHATPDPRDLKLTTAQVNRSFHLPDTQSMNYWSTIDLRLVVRPDTLVPYVSDWRRHWYIAMTEADKNERVVSSERIVAVSTYH
jgi:hypothetical protein